MSLSFYIIFHSKLYPQNTPDYPCFIYLAVNELIKKDIDTKLLKHPIINEYDLPAYNPIFQMLHFNENSVILNFPSPPTPFVGFCQYDMVIDPLKFQIVLNNISNINGAIGFYPYPIVALIDILNESQWNEILELYNSIHKTSHSMYSLKEYPFFFMNTYILPSWFYTRLQQNLKKLLPLVFKILEYKMKHLGGTLERLNALLIVCGIAEKIINFSISDAISDNRSQTIPDEFRSNPDYN
jgi:hypothetical protein